MKKPNPYCINNNINLTKHLSTPEVIMGHGSIGTLGNLADARLAIVLDTYLLESEFFANLTKNILTNVEYSVICDVKDEPSYAAIDPYIEKIQTFAPTHIVAIGGGSTIDTAKALWAFYEHPEYGWEDLDSGRPLKPFTGKAAMIAVPTTSGTGAEATGAAVYKKYDGSKALVIDKSIRPSHVILEFDLLASLPPKVVAQAGVDALAHVIGALSVETINPLDKMICTEVAVKILKALPISYTTGDAAARDTMHVCAYLAGDEINNAGGGLEHKLDMFAKAYHIPHGQIIGVFLPYTMLYLLPENHYLEIAEQLGIPGENAEEKQRGLVDMIWQIYDILGMPKTVRDTGVPERAYLDNLPKYVEMVEKIGHIYWIKGFKGVDSLRELYLQSYYGI